MKAVSSLFLVVLAALSLATQSAAQQVYRTVDKDGNVSYSDTPGDNSEAVDVKPANVQSFPAAPPPPPPEEAQKPYSYGLVEISSPANETTIRNEPQTRISAKLSPQLHENHRLVFLDNGKPLNEPGRSSSIVIDYMERGTHSLQVQVIDKQGKVLATSAAVTLYVHRSTVN